MHVSESETLIESVLSFFLFFLSLSASLRRLLTHTHKTDYDNPNIAIESILDYCEIESLPVLCRYMKPSHNMTIVSFLFDLNPCMAISLRPL